MSYKYAIIDSCHIANSEWRRRRPKSAYAESPAVKLEKRIGLFGDEAVCVSTTKPWRRDGAPAVSRDCDYSKESVARPYFDRLCREFFPWRTIPAEGTPKRLAVCTKVHAGIRLGIELTRDPTNGFCVTRFTYRPASALNIPKKVRKQRRKHEHECSRIKASALLTFKKWCGNEMKQRQVLSGR